MKVVRAVAPYLRKGRVNFKDQVFDAWASLGGRVARSHYPPAWLHGLTYRCEIPRLGKSRREARLRFVEPVSLSFDAFPDYARYEIIPLVWDCWPQYDDRVVAWFRRHGVQTCIFTCRESAERIRRRLPHLRMLLITEGIDTRRYAPGLPLAEREIDYYTYGRLRRFANPKVSGLRIRHGGNDEKFRYALQHARLVAAFPQCDVLPERTGGQETLTQRYWECMLSRMVMVGRAPRELTELIGYNPVVDVDKENFEGQIEDILAHIGDYQPLVDKNRETALRMADWTLRVSRIMEFLRDSGYET